VKERERLKTPFLGGISRPLGGGESVKSEDASKAKLRGGGPEMNFAGWFQQV